jgi:NADP-dependent 3-hydroxy acid dehydrogenase YdfG
MTEPRPEVLIVTGASRGIGAAVAFRAARAGYRPPSPGSLTPPQRLGT